MSSSNTQHKHEFGSKDWLRALEQQIARLASGAAPDLRFHICEVFTGVPPHLDGNGNATIAWNCKITGSSIAFAEEEADGADFKATGDYQYLLPLARWHVDASSSAEFERYVADGHRRGLLRRSGDAPVPEVLAGLHNIVVAFTK